MAKELKIGKHVIGTGHPTYIIAEIGINHNGDIKIAEEMIRAAKQAGVSAVIMSVVFDMAAGVIKSRDKILLVIMVLAFIANYFLKINVVFIILATAAVGALRTILRERKEGERP